MSTAAEIERAIRKLPAVEARAVANQVGGTTPFVKVWSTRSSNSLTFTDSITGTPVNFAAFAPDGTSVANQVGGDDGISGPIEVRQEIAETERQKRRADHQRAWVGLSRRSGRGS